MTPEQLILFESENSPLHYPAIWPFDKPQKWKHLRKAVESGWLRPLCGGIEDSNLILNSYVLTDAGREVAGLPPIVKVVSVLKQPKPKQEESRSLFGDDEC